MASANPAAGSGAEPPLLVDHAAKAFASVVAVDDVSFSVRGGEVYGLLGPNGAGKTTLLRMCLGILRPDSGRVAILGGEPTRERLDRVAYLPEERGLYMSRRVGQIMRYLGELKGIPRDQVEPRAQEWLERLGLGHAWKLKAGSLSKGNRQKVQIAACLMTKPDILVFDEPFTGLDPVNSRVVADLVRSQADAGVAVLLSTHQMSRAEELCDRVGLIARGRIVREGAVDQLTLVDGGRSLVIQADRDLSDCPLADVTGQAGPSRYLRLKDGVTRADLLRWLGEQGVEVESLATRRISLDEVFVREVARYVEGAQDSRSVAAAEQAARAGEGA